MLRWRNPLIQRYKRDEVASRAVSTCAKLGPPTILTAPPRGAQVVRYAYTFVSCCLARL
jgi:hypothetical protein